MRGYWLNTRSFFHIFVSAVFYLASSALLVALAVSWYFAKAHPLTFAGEFSRVVATVLAPVAVIVVLWAVLFRLILHIVLSRRYRSSGLAEGPVVNRISPEGLQVEPSKVAQDLTPWSRFRYWRESGAMFLVSAGNKEYCILPKSALTSDQQRELRTQLSLVLRRK